MKGDFTRTTFRPEHHRSGVRLQQGRVQLDADFNEQVDIEAHRDRVAARNLFGRAAASEERGGFEVTPGALVAAIAGSGASLRAVGQLATILVSEDEGRTWQRHAPPDGISADLHDLAIPATGSSVAVGDGPTILLEDAAGWTAQTVPAGAEGALRGLSFADDRHGWAVGDEGLILATSDGGVTWTPLAHPQGAGETLHDVAFRDANNGAAVGEGGRILVTSDGGQSWSVADTASVTRTLRSVAFLSASRLVAVGDGATIVASSDGGASWSLGEAPRGITATLCSLARESAQGVWAVGNASALLHSTDGGATWRALSGPQGDLTAAHAHGRGLFVATDPWAIALRSDAGRWSSSRLPETAPELALSAGEIYVDGLLCESESSTRYLAQRDLPRPPLPAESGRYVAFLDVWERHLTAIEDPGLAEVALGGPDTATRTKTVWQLRLEGPLEPGTSCGQLPGDWTPAASSAGGALRARGTPEELTGDECLIPAHGGYRRLENQLYRVEVIDPGAPGTARFAWSRDNAATLALLDDIVPAGPGLIEITVSDAGRDAVTGFAGARLIELTDEERILHGSAGTVLEVETVVEDRITVKAPPAGTLSRADFGERAFARRWDGSGAVTLNGSSAPGGWIALEDGVEVQFGAGGYATGDYWMIPARTNTATVEWPERAGEPEFAPPHGIEHSYCPLALVDRDADGNWRLAADCRPTFPTLPELARRRCAGTCTVSVAPGDDLASAIASLPPAGGELCLGAGQYALDEPLVVADRERIVLSGAGPATVVRAVRSEAALVFERCTDIEVRDMRIEGAQHPGPQREPHLNGAITFRDGSDVRLRDCVLSCPQSHDLTQTCATFRGTAAIVVENNRFEVGAWQTGLLVVDPDQVLVNENQVRLARARAQEFAGESLGRALAAWTREADSSSHPFFALRADLDRIMTPTAIRRHRGEEGARDALAHAVSRGERVEALSRASRLRLASIWGQWRTVGQGIVIAGSSIGTARITDNLVQDTVQGIHVGISDPDRPGAELSGQVMLRGNTVHARVPRAYDRGRHAVFVGNARNLQVLDTVATIERTGPTPESGQSPVEGIRIWGTLGPYVAVRGASLDRFEVGLRFTSVVRPPDTCVWSVSEFVATGALTTIDAPDLHVGSVPGFLRIEP